MEDPITSHLIKKDTECSLNCLDFVLLVYVNTVIFNDYVYLLQNSYIISSTKVLNIDRVNRNMSESVLLYKGCLKAFQTLNIGRNTFFFES